ncbi:hypothetical protein LSAT2_009242 [Lamellibrachia satsuma]|nr:hypothetical protein LSAT2_009242 [Lamellibrachia satsuma]
MIVVRSYEDDSRLELTPQSGRHFQASTKRAGTRSLRDHNSEIREARKQVIKMLLTIIGIFLFCWGPKLILNIMKRHKLGYILHRDVAFYIMLVIHLLPYIQSCVNPIIYSIMSNNFQRSLRSACHTYCHCRSRCSRLVRRQSSDYDMDPKSYNGNTYQTYLRSPLVNHHSVEWRPSL